MATLNRDRMAQTCERERRRFADLHPRSALLSHRAREHMQGGVPMSWMVKWPGDFPIFIENAKGAHFTDADGIEYVDFCLGDTGAMAGHSPRPPSPR